MEEEALGMSGLRRPNNGFQIVFGGFDSKDTLHRPIIEWLPLYCVGTVGDYDPNSVNDMRTLMCTLDVTSPSDVIDSKKQILVTSQIRHGPHGYHDSCPEATFYTYNVTTRCWATLEPPVRKLGDDYLVVRAYDLDKDVWFEGSMNIREELFVKLEYLSYGELDRVPFLHLYDQKFFLLVPSDISKRTWKWKLLEQEIHYLNCFIFEVTPIFKNQDEEGFCELSRSVVSVLKSPMNNNFQILEGMLMQPTISVSTALVKQPHEETRAGMTDCEKSLLETVRELKKARETRG
nr:hypothetical protein CFP56_67932 [Quercus suber]